ncbi:UvrD-helicase domain-containing protein [Micromonospora purpureochromogenes]|uniref:UvrD-helicase domain-containing protein n=1 Tax=Micromonospora purpureochromogenes TaxID=47872 RepID=UPI00363D96FE
MPERALLAPSAFFQLTDAVLKRAGRQPLDPDGPQRRIVAVNPRDRVLQILAGPGSGKTEMLVWRILYELLVCGSNAETLLVTTFTRKAATELEVRLVERCDAVLEEAHRVGVAVDDPHVHDVRVGTLHSLCDALLREFDSHYSESGTQLMDEHETTVRLARDYRFQLGYSSANAAPRAGNLVIDTDEVAALFRPPWEGDRWPSNDMQRVELLKAALAQHTETWMPRCAADGTLNGIEAVAPAAAGVTDALETLYSRWVDYLDENSVIDFTTIQQRFLERQGAVLSELRHVFVDEFQDTNPVQFAIHVGWLAGPGTRLTVVGDDDQSIYRFRGSDIACFQGLELECAKLGLEFRLEKLEHNYRSTNAIVAFSEAFRTNSVLQMVSMPKHIEAAADAPEGQPVRLLTGDWSQLCDVVAAELLAASPSPEATLVPDAAVLMFSTSEKNTRQRLSPAWQMRTALEDRRLRVFNARNKTAGEADSPVHDLLALLSYLIDPVRTIRLPGKTRAVQVCASHQDRSRRPYAEAAEPKYASLAHSRFQTRFRKAGGSSLDNPPPERAELLEFIDNIRQELVRAASATSDRRRLTLSALVARLMSYRYFRRCGYTPQLFRQALFTALLEANVAPTRRSMRSLDQPMRPALDANGKVEWPQQYWDFLRVMGTMLESTSLDDEEVEAFSENAIAMLTFHQAKGLEFDHVYVAATGRNVMPANALRTALFSGKGVPYVVTDGQAETTDQEILRLAAADREREVYVAFTRAKQHLTILLDSSHSRTELRTLNPALSAIFEQLPASPHPLDPSVTVKAFPHTVLGGSR